MSGLLVPKAPDENQRGSAAAGAPSGVEDVDQKRNSDDNKQKTIEKFGATCSQAIAQIDPDNGMHCSEVTMKLMCELLNRQYNCDHVYFAVLNDTSLPAGFMSFAAFRTFDLFLFHQDNDVWSAAWINRKEWTISLFDSTTTFLEDLNVANDIEKRARLEALCAKLAEPRYLGTLGIPPKSMEFREAPMVCAADGTRSGPSCLAWAEAYYKGWEMCAQRKGEYHQMWTPMTDEVVQWPRLAYPGSHPWAYVLMERARMADLEVLHAQVEAKEPFRVGL